MITGENGYIGNSLINYIKKYNRVHQNHEVYKLDCISVRGNEWRKIDFLNYDVILHAAGVVHQKERHTTFELYKKVNVELTLEIANKAKNSGVKQFIFLSSMSVYGINSGTITRETIPKPTTYYGWSKLEAETRLKEMEDDCFRISIVRPPMVYGKGCKGNYTRLSNFAKIMPFLPVISNQKSMIYIENLCEFLRVLISEQKYGVFFPQNEEYVCTSEMCNLIAKLQGKRVIQINGLSDMILKLTKKNKFLNKVYGNLVYESSISDLDNTPYCVENFLNSIRKTEDVNEEGITDYNS